MNIEKALLETNNFKELKDFQKKAFTKKGNLVISAPTASGKTLIAEGFALQSILEKKKKAVFTTPLRALSAEHWREFKKKYSNFGIKIALSTGDFDSSSEYLDKYDWIITTNEKLDSLLRHNAKWLENIGLLVIDEIHEIDSDRGPVIEILTAKMQSLNPKIQIIGLSATIPNSKEIAEWLNAENIENKTRPVPLKQGIYFDSEIEFENEKINKELEEFIREKTKDKQILFFANTRKNAEQTARKFSEIIEMENKELRKKIENVLEHPTEQCLNLGKIVEKGTAFHHAGLLQKQRQIIEEGFINGKIKIISATPTLAAGVNLPANTVIISSLYRYTQYGMQPIKVREYKQMSGRAGRPRYDNEGIAIVIARNSQQAEMIKENYVNGEDEEIVSKLSQSPVLRMHLLALSASNYIFDIDSMSDFFKKTFFAKQFGRIDEILFKLEDIRKELEEMGFMEGYKATDLGKRVSELYIDPLSAYKIIKNLEKYKGTFAHLYAIADTTELGGINVKKEAYELIEEKKEQIPNYMDLEYEDYKFTEKVALASVLEEWINEEREQEIMNTYGILPGQLKSILEMSDWIAYSAKEITKINEIEKTRQRLKNGVKEELLQLVKVRGIGRVRARNLYRAGIKKIGDLRKTDIMDLGRILGQTIAVKIKQQVEKNKKETLFKEIIS